MSTPSLSTLLKAASQAATSAGAILAKHAGKPRTVQTKRSAIDLVTEIDKASEALIRRALGRVAPDFGFLGEEGGESRGRTGWRWIVDPLDGTNNFVHGLPIFGVSIGLQQGERMMAGVIYDPMRKELFTAVRGKGAHLNGARIRVSPATDLKRSLLSTGFSTNFLTHDQPYLRWFQTLQRRSHGVRRIGSTVYSLACVACGRMEGFYERDLSPWDFAAGMLLVEEAGGRVSDVAGKPARLESGQLVATNGRIHPALIKLLG